MYVLSCFDLLGPVWVWSIGSEATIWQRVKWPPWSFVRMVRVRRPGRLLGSLRRGRGCYCEAVLVDLADALGRSPCRPLAFALKRWPVGGWRLAFKPSPIIN